MESSYQFYINILWYIIEIIFEGSSMQRGRCEGLPLERRLLGCSRKILTCKKLFVLILYTVKFKLDTLRICWKWKLEHCCDLKNANENLIGIGLLKLHTDYILHIDSLIFLSNFFFFFFLPLNSFLSVQLGGVKYIHNPSFV